MNEKMHHVPREEQLADDLGIVPAERFALEDVQLSGEVNFNAEGLRKALEKNMPSVVALLQHRKAGLVEREAARLKAGDIAREIGTQMALGGQEGGGE